MRQAKTVLVRNINFKSAENPTGTSKTRVDAERYEAMKKALLKAAPRGKTGIALSELPQAVRKHLPGGALPGGGKITWHVMAVKLDLEARGLLERIPGSSPQRVRRTS